MALRDGEQRPIPELDLLLNSSERELIFYVHFLEEYNNTRIYISGINYLDMKSMKMQIRNAILKVDNQGFDVVEFIDVMSDRYHDLAIYEDRFTWLKNDRRACFWLLFTVLLAEDSYLKRERADFINGLNIQSGMVYYLLVAWFDKIIHSKEEREQHEKKLFEYENEWANIKGNPIYPWLERGKSPEDIQYCLNYIKDQGMGIISPAIPKGDVHFIFDFQQKHCLDEKEIVIAVFDYVSGYQSTGNILADNLKMKMANGLSSWRNRKNKEDYSDLHFDIKKTNIPKLDDLKKRFNLLSKKDVVNELIERFYKQDE